MNSTGLVGCIALLMILGASLGGANRVESSPIEAGIKTSALESAPSYPSRSFDLIIARTPTQQPSIVPVAEATSSPARDEIGSRYIEVTIHGHVYGGTLFPVRETISLER